MGMTKAKWCANQITKIVDGDHLSYDSFSVEGDVIVSVTFYEQHQPTALSQGVPAVELLKEIVRRLPGRYTGLPVSELS